MLKKIDALLAVLPDEYQPLRAFYSNFLYFVFKDCVDLSKIVLEILINKIKEYKGKEEELSPLLKATSELYAFLQKADSADSLNFAVLKKELPASFSPPKISSSALGKVKGFITRLLGRINIESMLEVPDEGAEGEKSIAYALELYTQLINYIEKRQRGMVSKKSLKKSSSKDKTLNYFKNYAKSYVQRRYYYHTDLTDKRIEIASELIGLVQKSVELSHKKSLRLTLLISYYVVLQIEENLQVLTQSNKEHSFLTSSGEGRLHTILVENREKFLDLLKSQFQQNASYLGPAAANLLLLLNKKDYSKISSTDIISGFVTEDKPVKKETQLSL